MKKHHLCAYALLLLTLSVVSPAQSTVDVSKLAARPTVDWARWRDLRNLPALRKSSEALRRGDVEWVSNTNDACIISFERHATTEDALVVINSCNRPEEAHLDASVAGFRDVTPNIAKDDALPTEAAATDDVSLGAWGFHVYRTAVRPQVP